MSSSGKQRLCPRVLAFTLLSGCLTFCILSLNVHAQECDPFAARTSPLVDDMCYNDAYCPAYFHSCASSGTDPYFAPDPFDVGAACDDNFMQYVLEADRCGPSDIDCNGINDNSCYGKCDLNCNRNGICNDSCYANCQLGSDGQSGYVGCLRSAFGITRQSIRTESPRHLPNFAGNVYRSCIAGNPPALYIDEYNSCIAGGGTVSDCCNQVASHFP
jgi:hypothetical protein